jgi:hypothetical protein
MNTQAFRNWMFTRGNCADAAMELYFRNSKGIKEESSELKKGTIHDSLSHLFTFQTIRVAHVARELGTLMAKNKFMDCDAPKDDTWVKSTLYRWMDQVTVVYTKCALCACVSKLFLQVALIPNCTLQRTMGDYYVVLESVNKTGHMLEAVTRVHIVCVAGFEFEDTQTNVRVMCIFFFLLHTTRHTCRWYPPALVLPIETQRIAVPASCTHFQRMHGFVTGMGNPGTRKSCWPRDTVLTATHSLKLHKCWRSPHKQRSLCTPQMPHLECPAKSF